MTKKASEIISDFLQLLRESEPDYEYNYSEVHRMDLLETDISHKFELVGMTHHQYAALGKKVKECRQERRVYKDRVELLEPIRDYYLGNKKAYNDITRLLGDIRKVEKQQEDRCYMPRIMTMEEWKNGN
jgi:hypothetical protein